MSDRPVDLDWHGDAYRRETGEGATVSITRQGARICVAAHAALTADEADDLAYNLRCAAAAARLYPTVGEPT